MRIVVACELWYPDTFGGSERHAAETAHHLAARGHDVSVWTLRNRTAELPRHERDGRLEVNRRGSVASYRVLPRTIPMLGVGLAGARAARSADLVITHHLWPSVTIGLRRGGPPILHQFHASPSLEWAYNAGSTSRHLETGPLKRLRPAALRGYGRAIGLAERRTLSQAQAVTALSEFSRDIIAEHHPAVLERLTLVPGGVDTDRFRPAEDRPGLRERLGWRPEDEVLLTVRRLAPRMGVSQLLQALARLAPERPNARLVVVGDGFLRPSLEEEARALGLGDRVTFLGRVEDARLCELYQAADIFVLPTQAYEGFGMVTLEALAAGTPVVATPAGATPEILVPLEPGLVCPDPGEEALAERLGHWLAGGGLPEMRARARSHALTYSWPRVMDRYEELCERVAREGRG